MTDHRTIPGIEFVACPGPLRVGDYWRSAYAPTIIYKVDGGLDVVDNGGIKRVIPHVRPLEVPEPCEPEVPEVITWTSIFVNVCAGGAK